MLFIVSCGRLNANQILTVFMQLLMEYNNFKLKRTYNDPTMKLSKSSCLFSVYTVVNYSSD